MKLLLAIPRTELHDPGSYDKLHLPGKGEYASPVSFIFGVAEAEAEGEAEEEGERKDK